jgi:dihydrofolate reductase
MKLIVANSENGVIGKNGKIPWESPKDLERFKRLTDNSYVIMGRKTFESIGKPLKNRINIILSKTIEKIDGAYVFKNINDVLIWLSNQKIAFPKMEQKVFVIGGEEIYKQFLEKNLIDAIYQTIVKNNECKGDSFFKFNEDKFEPLVKDETKDEIFYIWVKKSE